MIVLVCILVHYFSTYDTYISLFYTKRFIILYHICDLIDPYLCSIILYHVIAQFPCFCYVLHGTLVPLFCIQVFYYFIILLFSTLISLLLTVNNNFNKKVFYDMGCILYIKFIIEGR